MSAVMMLEIVVGIVILAAAIWFAVGETRRLQAAMETDVEPVETAPVSEGSSEPQAQPAAEHEEAAKPEEQEAEQVSEVSATETK
jgi:cytoskeletal protein RodZ